MDGVTLQCVNNEKTIVFDFIRNSSSLDQLCCEAFGPRYTCNVYSFSFVLFDSSHTRIHTTRRMDFYVCVCSKQMQTVR